MTRFSLRYKNIRRTVASGWHSKLLFSEGNIFDGSYGFDGIAVFIPPTLGLFNREYDYYIANKEPMDHPFPVVVYGYDWRKEPSLYYPDIKIKVYDSLNYLKNHGCRKIGFHGIRTYDATEYECESETILSVVK